MRARAEGFTSMQREQDKIIDMMTTLPTKEAYCRRLRG
jgi:hypothetical protein